MIKRDYKFTWDAKNKVAVPKNGDDNDKKIEPPVTPVKKDK